MRISRAMWGSVNASISSLTIGDSTRKNGMENAMESACVYLQGYRHCNVRAQANRVGFPCMFVHIIIRAVRA